MRFLEIKLRGVRMDASKTESQKKKEEKGRVGRFIFDGNWPGWQECKNGKVKLGTEEWMYIIGRILNRADDIFKNLSDFTPIKHLINKKPEKMQASFITPEDIVIFSEGVNLETHCHEVCSLEIENIKRSEGEYFEESKILLITRKREWIVWHRKLDKTYAETGSEYISRLAKFEKVDDISLFLKKYPTSILESFNYWLRSDIHADEEKLRRKKIISSLLVGICERARQIV